MEPMLDLDVPPDAESGLVDRFRRRRFGVLPMAVAVLLAMASAAAATHVVEDRQRRASEQAEVSLTTLVGRSGSVSGDSRTMTIEGSLAVANSGPLPVVVEEVRGSAGGLTFLSTASATIRPGVDWILVTVTASCAEGISGQPLPAVLKVRTADGQARVTSSLMIVQGTPWATTHEQICRPVTQAGR
ncbi:hypothetical protein Ais01nite_03370 [Asanoa ishikariensis]|uniref:Uncharacterized protein n=1 Tax=Asanoa ishikariensis TaxID=137265 RepID=A0A1H3TKN6_9ACTN|nr:hypothetical protein [Asanoa ishikariensis]GIF62302.1 hypothetical protein Ais01nite_03370 [Asanoa ishikariensis]SDZ50428.1 hypothetical protein SAMN05421684_5893 [Asanoa ishikariensis]